MSKPKYYYCTSFDELVNLVAGHIKNTDTRGVKFGSVTFKVEFDESVSDKAMSQEALGAAFAEATGAYGVTAVDPFQQDTTTVLVGYYHTGTEVRSFTVDSTADRDYLTKLTRQVKEALFNTLLAHCDEGASKFLVEIKG
jgi:hypothetical protein